MLRSSLFTAATLLIGASAFAQENISQKLHKLTHPPRDAGTYHLSTGTWTRNTNQANLGDKVIIYNNTCNVRYYSSLTPGTTWFDEGRIPSPSGPDAAWAPLPASPQVGGTSNGCATSYTINGFQSAACFDFGFGGAGEDMTLTFIESYLACSPPTAAPAASFLITGIPGGTPLGNVNCWIFTIDLKPVPPSTVDFTFTMMADGNGSFDGVNGDTFGWGFSFPSVTGTDLGGPLLAGDYHHASPIGCSGFDGTVFDGPAGAAAPTFPANGAFEPPFSGASEDGTGMDTFDGFRLDPGFFVGSPPQFASCFFFGGIPGNPLSSMWLELYAPLRCPPDQPGTGYCFGDGLDTVVTALCPCGNFGGAGAGCANSFSSLGGLLSVAGTTVPNTINFTLTRVPNNTLCAGFRNTTNTNPGGVVFGDGVRCQTGTLIRFGQHNSGTVGDPVNTWTSPTNSQGAGVTRFYQVQYRNSAPAFCPPATFNISNGRILTW
jgi:hypothetical protein